MNRNVIISLIGVGLFSVSVIGFFIVKATIIDLNLSNNVATFLYFLIAIITFFLGASLIPLYASLEVLE